MAAEMNRRHAAALALVGWYLMMPPDRCEDTTSSSSIIRQCRVPSFPNVIRAEKEKPVMAQIDGLHDRSDWKANGTGEIAEKTRRSKSGDWPIGHRLGSRQRESSIDQPQMVETEILRCL